MERSRSSHVGARRHLAAGVVGCVAGQVVHARLDNRSYQRATLGLLAVAAATATLAAVM